MAHGTNGDRADATVDGAVARPDLARVASAFADRRRMRVLLALADGRALPAGRLAEEAGVSASTASNHLRILLDEGLVVVRAQGRHRYFTLARPEIADVIEALARVADPTPITSLREHTRSHALRTARMCYSHLAGRLGVSLFGALLERGWVVGGDGRTDPAVDRLSAPGRGVHYRVGDEGVDALARLGLTPDVLLSGPVRYCVDWTEQVHHLSGPLGRALADLTFARGWVVRGAYPRAVVVTESGGQALRHLLGIEVGTPPSRPAGTRADGR